MISQNQVVFIAQVCDQPRLFFFVQSQPFVIVISERSQGKHRLLRNRQQAILLRRDGNAVVGVQMHNAQRVFARLMHGAVNREAGRVDEVRRVHHFVAGQIDLYQA